MVVVIADSDRQDLLRLILANDVTVKVGVDLTGFELEVSDALECFVAIFSSVWWAVLGSASSGSEV